ncbi:hypothetical protein A3K63_04030 [Candidatus Micrarchaeota archaeon RBG_16_49_10]|nr:MAG: hypothetical protein A3K63_04030 [Candidatus Micrarchaeota archaeon RBG_16_49_10]
MFFSFINAAFSDTVLLHIGKAEQPQKDPYFPFLAAMGSLQSLQEYLFGLFSRQRMQVGWSSALYTVANLPQWTQMSGIATLFSFSNK